MLEDVLKGKSRIEIHKAVDALIEELMQTDSEKIMFRMERMSQFAITPKFYREMLYFILDDVSPEAKKEVLQVMTTVYLDII